MRDEFEESKRARCIEVLGPLISLLDRCGSPTEFLVQIKQDLLAERDREAIQAYEAIQMPGMGGFLDLWLCKENGHTVRNAPQDNALLDHLILDLDHAIHHLDVYRRRRIRHSYSDPITPSVQALDRLLDPVAGAVHLRMVPYHLDRLHLPHPRGAKKGPEGLPFPFLEGVGPFDVVWRGGHES